MTRIIRENRDEEADLNSRVAIVDAAKAELGSNKVIGPYFPRPGELPAGSPASPGGASVTFEELDDSVIVQAGAANAVQNITELRAVTPAQRVDRQVRLVEDEEAVYRFDLESSTAESLPVIVAPDAGSGRWHRTDITQAEFDAHLADASAHHTRYANSEATAAIIAAGLALFVQPANRNNASVTNIWLRGADRLPFNQSPIRFPFPVRLIAIAATGGAVQTWDAEVWSGAAVRAGGVPVDGGEDAQLSVVAANGITVSGLAVNYAANTEIGVFMRGTTINRPRVDLYLVRTG